MYQVFGEAIHTETDERFVVYKPLYPVPEPEKYRVRPKEMFFEEVEVDGVRIARFKLIQEDKSR